jgi:hypothetical protein
MIPLPEICFPIALLPIAGCSMPPGITVPTFEAAEAARLNDNTITYGEVHAALTGLLNGRAAGASEAASRISALCRGLCLFAVTLWPPAHHSIHLLVPMLSRLFTSVFATSRVPESWKTAIMTPLYKKHDPTNPDNYRPIVVGVPMVRFFAIILDNRMSSYLESQCLRAEAQAGFRARRSVSHNLFALQHADKHTGRTLVVEGPHCTAVSWTSLQPSIMCRGRSCGNGSIPWGYGVACLGQCRPCMLATSRLAIKVDGRVGEAAHTHTGVRQCCPLSPTLFGVFIDALQP